MDPETNHQTNHQFRRLPKGERRVRFADSMGMELVSIFLFDLINTYYFASIHNSKHHYLQPQLQSLPPSSLRTESSLKQHPSIKPYAKPFQEESPSNINNNNNNNNNNYIHTNNNNNHYSYSSNFHQQNQKHHLEQRKITTTEEPKPLPTSHQKAPPTTQRPLLQKQNSFDIQDAKQLAIDHQQQITNYVCEFTQPISLISFRERVKINKVHLETCSIQTKAGGLSISCTIRVLNQSYTKSVLVRYTTDEWHTFHDCKASYKQGSNDGWSDRFGSTFTIATGAQQSLEDNNNNSAQVDHYNSNPIKEKERVIFAIKYSYDGKESWDNNGGLNYVVRKY